MRLAQQDGFHEDYELVKRSKPLPSSSPLIKLNPRIDKSGVIRSDGHLKFAEQLPYKVRHPVIRPRGTLGYKINCQALPRESKP